MPERHRRPDRGSRSGRVVIWWSGRRLGQPSCSDERECAAGHRTEDPDDEVPTHRPGGLAGAPVPRTYGDRDHRRATPISTSAMPDSQRVRSSRVPCLHSPPRSVPASGAGCTGRCTGHIRVMTDIRRSHRTDRLTDDRAVRRPRPRRRRTRRTKRPWTPTTALPTRISARRTPARSRPSLRTRSSPTIRTWPPSCLSLLVASPVRRCRRLDPGQAAAETTKSPRLESDRTMEDDDDDRTRRTPCTWPSRNPPSRPTLSTSPRASRGSRAGG